MRLFTRPLSAACLLALCFAGPVRADIVGISSLVTTQVVTDWTADGSKRHNNFDGPKSTTSSSSFSNFSEETDDKASVEAWQTPDGHMGAVARANLSSGSDLRRNVVTASTSLSVDISNQASESRWIAIDYQLHHMHLDLLSAGGASWGANPFGSSSGDSETIGSRILYELTYSRDGSEVSRAEYSAQAWGGYYEFAPGSGSNRWESITQGLSATGTQTGCYPSGGCIGISYDIEDLSGKLNLGELAPGESGSLLVRMMAQVIGYPSETAALARIGDPIELNTDNPSGPFSLSIVASTSPVPVPGAVWLFGSGLLGLAAVRRRKIL